MADDNWKAWIKSLSAPAAGTLQTSAATEGQQTPAGWFLIVLDASRHDCRVERFATPEELATRIRQLGEDVHAVPCFGWALPYVLQNQLEYLQLPGGKLLPLFEQDNTVQTKSSYFRGTAPPAALSDVELFQRMLQDNLSDAPDTSGYFMDDINAAEDGMEYPDEWQD